jgi:two-component system OmpR family response regulator
MKVLLIEDDQRLARLIARVLRDEHYQVDVVHDGDTGLEYALRGVYQVAIIDWMLPERDGPSICRAVRTARLPTALLLLTARGQVEDKIVGFDSGADDYLVKPFAFEELLARVRALGRRFSLQPDDSNELRVGDLVLDLRHHTARRGTRPLDLTPTEWNLLEYLMRNAGQALSPPADSRPCLVLRSRCATADGRCVHCLSAPQTECVGRARPDCNRPWRGVSVGGKPCLADYDCA